MRSFLFCTALALTACADPALDTAIVHGQISVTGAETGALAGQTVLLLPTRGTGATSTLTDADGRFTIPELAAGDYVVSATLPETVEATQSAPVVVLRGATVDAPALAFTGTGSVTGHVTDTSQVPLPSAQVLVGGQALPVTTNNDGQYEVTQVPAGNQIVVAYATGRSSAIGYANVTWRGHVEVSPLMLAFASGLGLVSGKVIYPGPVGPVPPIRVEVDDGKWQGNADDNGVFSIAGVPDGVHSLDFYEQEPANSGEPEPLHNRLPRVLTSGGQAFTIGADVHPLNQIPLFRGRRLGGIKLGQSPDGKWLLMNDGTLALLALDGTTQSLAKYSTCTMLSDGALCSGATLWDPGSYAPLTFVPYDTTQAVVHVSDAALAWKTLPDGKHVLIGEPGSASNLVLFRVVDGHGGSVTFDREVIHPLHIELTASGNYVAATLPGPQPSQYGSVDDTFVFDTATGTRVNSGCWTGLFLATNDHFICNASDGLVDLAPTGDRRVIGAQAFNPTDLSPDGKYLLWVGSGWTDYRTVVVALSDGHVVADMNGMGYATWSSDGAHAWLFLSHNGPPGGELVDVALPSGNIKTIDTFLWCRTVPATPELRLCNSKTEDLAINLANGKRFKFDDNTTGYQTFVVGVADKGGIAVYTNPPGQGDGGRINWLDPTSLANEQVILHASLDYYSVAGPSSLIDHEARRIVSTIYDYGDVLVWDRQLAKSFYLGGQSATLTSTRQFLGDGSLLTQRTAPGLGLGDLAGLYLTEFAP